MYDDKVRLLYDAGSGFFCALGVLLLSVWFELWATVLELFLISPPMIFC